VDKFGEAQPLKEGSAVCRYCYCEVKQWVSLTDEEVNKYFENEWLTYDNYYDVFKVILEWQEEKLRIKNG
jgi:hypothetical protein